MHHPKIYVTVQCTTVYRLLKFHASDRHIADKDRHTMMIMLSCFVQVIVLVSHEIRRIHVENKC